MGVLDLFTGGAGKAIKDGASAFRPNAEARDAREDELILGAQKELSAEFNNQPTGIFGRIADALNRMARPVLAFGTLYAFSLPFNDPDRFSQAMRALELVPEPMWHVLTAVVALYTGSRIHKRQLHHKQILKRQQDYADAAYRAKNPPKPEPEG